MIEEQTLVGALPPGVRAVLSFAHAESSTARALPLRLAPAEAPLPPSRAALRASVAQAQAAHAAGDREAKAAAQLAQLMGEAARAQMEDDMTLRATERLQAAASAATKGMAEAGAEGATAGAPSEGTAAGARPEGRGAGGA